MDNTARTLSYIQAKPILKWAGGKTQMLNDLLPKVPSSYGRYIEPFFGGGDGVGRAGFGRVFGIGHFSLPCGLKMQL